MDAKKAIVLAAVAMVLLYVLTQREQAVDAAQGLLGWLGDGLAALLGWLGLKGGA